MHERHPLPTPAHRGPAATACPMARRRMPGGSRSRILRGWSGHPRCRAVARRSIGHCLKKDSGPARSSSGSAAAKVMERPRWLSAAAGALRAAVGACRAAGACRGAVVVLDRSGEFYPLAAVAQGIEPARLIVVHPGNKADHAWALDQALRCPAVAAVVAWPESLDGKLDGRTFRRLQLAVEQGGGLGLLIRPESVHAQPSWADVRLLVEPLPSTSPYGRRREYPGRRCASCSCVAAAVVAANCRSGDDHGLGS